MHNIHVQDYFEWRTKARECLQNDIAPEKITWLDKEAKQSSLFSQIIHTSELLVKPRAITVNKEFISLAEAVSCHNTHAKWGKLYEALWRLTHGEKNLLAISSDPLINQLKLFEKAVRRDCHKMKAFVRFRRYEIEKVEYYLAWHEPDHSIIERVAPFFQRRFSVMNWIIISPVGTAMWDQKNLSFLPGIENFSHLQTDHLENLWKTYYKSIFNPGRIKQAAMRREMPVRYWKNLPETQIIQEMLKDAPLRVLEMLRAQQD